MGANVSSQTTEVINKTITDQSSEIMNSTEMSTRSELTADQKMNVDFRVGGTIKNCDLNFIQDLKIVNKIYSKIDSQMQQELVKKIEEKLDNEAKNEVMQDISGLNLGAANISETNNYIENYSFHDLSTLVVNTLANHVNNAIDANQDQVIRVNIAGDFDCSAGDAKGLIVAQNIDIENIIENTLKDKKVTKAINDFSKEVQNKATNKTTQTITGIDPFAIFGMIAGICLVIAIIIVAIIFGRRASKK